MLLHWAAASATNMNPITVFIETGFGSCDDVLSYKTRAARGLIYYHIPRISIARAVRLNTLLGGGVSFVPVTRVTTPSKNYDETYSTSAGWGVGLLVRRYTPLSALVSANRKLTWEIDAGMRFSPAYSDGHAGRISITSGVLRDSAWHGFSLAYSLGFFFERDCVSFSYDLLMGWCFSPN